MLAVDSEHIPAPMQDSAHEQEIEPSLTEPDVALPKQQSKKKLLTPLNIMIILAAVTLIGLGGYYLFSLSSGTDTKNKITESHDKIISYADSSSQKGSNTGSTSSKSSSSNNNKPNGKSQPAGKTVISSNSKLTGAGSPPSGGGDDEDDEDNNSDKHKSGSGASSTDIDSESESGDIDSEEDGQTANDPIVWVDTKAPTSATAGTPMVGSSRDGGK
ncbi:MAG: hypothetical protein KDD45_05825 [Bdellovibrionales bacterium]|nr:hypothetical protein [Bdellovibrionales bacterium]